MMCLCGAEITGQSDLHVGIVFAGRSASGLFSSCLNINVLAIPYFIKHVHRERMDAAEVCCRIGTSTKQGNHIIP